MESATQEQLLNFPKRPNVSSKFKSKPIQLISNHFTISLLNNQHFIYLYVMKIIEAETEEQIPADARKLRYSILKSANQSLKGLYGDNYWPSGFVLWSTRNQADLKTIRTAQDEKDYLIVLVKSKEVSLGSEIFQNNETAASARQYLNVIIQRYFKQRGFKEWNMNAKFYDWKNKILVPNFRLMICAGFKTSCEIYQNFTPKVLIDFTSRIIHSDNALVYIKSLQEKGRSTQEIREMLQGTSVVASYGNFRPWRIDDVDFTSNPMSLSKIDDKVTGKVEISIFNYFKSKYNITIKDLSQPLLVNINRKTEKKIFLVPELVQMTGLDDDMRKDSELMQQIANITRLNPKERMAKIKGEAQNLAINMEQYGIQMNQESIIDGHLLCPPKLTFGKTSFTPEGNFNLREPIFKPITLGEWLLVYPKLCREDADIFLETLEKCSGAYAINVTKPIKCEVDSKSPEDLRKIILAKVSDKTKIVACLYPKVAKKHWYKALKTVCLKEIGVPCQAIVSSTLKKNIMSVCSKVLLQMSAKIGSELWICENPNGLPEKTMIIGADVYHKTKVGEEKKSCIGFCASLNAGFSKFFSKVSFQNRVGEEIMTNIGKLVKEAILKYFAFNKKKFLPECIILFRDGLAENQLKLALEIETKAILSHFKTIAPDYNPKFAEIVVTKRIDDRIFTNQAPQRQSGRGGGPAEGQNIFNAPAGTVVADTIVSNNFDYLLVSQNVTQGTCTPTRFNVIYDTTGLSQDVFWQLSYWQSYNYFNWNGSVRVPAPVLYAHKLAYLVGQTVQGDPDKKLDQSLYYL